MPHLLISGGSRGIGRACVELFARKGYKVSSLSRTGRNEDAVDGVSYFVCDVKDPASKATIDHFGKKITFVNVMRNMSVDCD